MQVTVNANTLDNGTWRRIVGQFKRTVQGSATLDVFEATFLIFADTSSDLQARLDSTLSDFEGLSARVKATLDTSASNSYVDWWPGDGSHEDTQVAITSLPDEQDTGHRLICHLACAATKSAATIAGGASTPGGLEFDGQVNKFVMSEEFSESGGATVQVAGSFQPTIDEAAYGPLPVVSVADDSGQSKFTLTGVSPAVPTFKQGQRINISGTTNYDGIHIIESITQLTLTAEVVVYTPFTVPESPGSATATIDDFVTGEENYNAARSAILTGYLGCASDGSRDATTKRVLARENLTAQDSSGTYVDFILSSREQEEALPSLELAAGADITRGATINISLAPIERWNDRLGEKFTEVRVDGKIPITVGALSEKTLYEWWELVEPEIRSTVTSKTGISSLYLASMRPVLNYISNEITFSILYLGNFDDIIEYSDSMGVKERADYVAYSSEKGDILQSGPRARTIVAAFAARRVGKGRVEPRTMLRNPPIRKGGGVWVEDTFEESELSDTSENGDLIFTQEVKAAWTIYYPKSGKGAVVQRGNRVTYTP